MFPFDDSITSIMKERWVGSVGQVRYQCEQCLFRYGILIMIHEKVPGNNVAIGNHGDNTQPCAIEYMEITACPLDMYTIKTENY